MAWNISVIRRPTGEGTKVPARNDAAKISARIRMYGLMVRPTIPAIFIFSPCTFRKVPDPHPWFRPPSARFHLGFLHDNGDGPLKCRESEHSPKWRTP
jgi:hypothetical protein